MEYVITTKTRGIIVTQYDLGLFEDVNEDENGVLKMFNPHRRIALEFRYFTLHTSPLYT